MSFIDALVEEAFRPRVPGRYRGQFIIEEDSQNTSLEESEAAGQS